MGADLDIDDVVHGHPVAQQQLRELYERAERAEAERDALRALLREARDDWIKVGYGASHEDVAACRDFCDRIDAVLGEL